MSAPFSNGFEWEYWSANWCDRCLVDAPYRNGIAMTGCPLIAVAMLEERRPDEWLDGTDDLGDRYHCINFRAPGDGGGGEPKPKPQPRGQLELFGRDGHEGRRTLRPLPEHAPAVVDVYATGGVL